MKRDREEPAAGRGMIVQIVKFHTQVFQTRHILNPRFQTITERLAQLDKQMEDLITSCGVLISSNYRTNTLKYFKDTTADPSEAKVTYYLRGNTDCASWPEEFRPKVLNLYQMTVQLATEALQIRSSCHQPNINPSDPVDSEKSTSDNWLDGIDFTLFI